MSGCQADPELSALLDQERRRQIEGIELIASENFTSQGVLHLLGSVLTNKYSEGYPGKRYYGGNEVIDQIEDLCRQRALTAFGLNPAEWGVNVQPYSGSPANLEAFGAVLKPHDRIMGLDLSHGGHLTHGFYAGGKKISATSITYESMPYHIDPTTGLIDYDGLLKTALVFRPKLIIAGTSAYSRQLDYARFREICNEVGAILLADMAHIAGLVATGLHPSPFDHADVVTTTTHKTLRGPRSGMIFFRLNLNGENPLVPTNMQLAVDNAVFPMHQGGPHNHQIGALCYQLKEVVSPAFKTYMQSVLSNAQILASCLKDYGYSILTSGTDTHLLVWNLREIGLSGGKYEELANFVGITVNRNTIPGDKSPLNPGGVRLGTPAMTTRNCGEEQWKEIAGFLHRLVDIGLEIQEQKGKLLKDFKTGLNEENVELAQIKREVREFARDLPFPT